MLSDCKPWLLDSLREAKVGKAWCNNMKARMARRRRSKQRKDYGDFQKMCLALKRNDERQNPYALHPMTSALTAVYEQQRDRVLHLTPL